MMIPHGARQALRQMNERAVNEDEQADTKEEVPWNHINNQPAGRKY